VQLELAPIYYYLFRDLSIKLQYLPVCLAFFHSRYNIIRDVCIVLFHDGVGEIDLDGLLILKSHAWEYNILTILYKNRKERCYTLQKVVFCLLDSMVGYIRTENTF